MREKIISSPVPIRQTTKMPPKFQFGIASELFHKLLDCFTEVRLVGVLICTKEGIMCSVTDDNISTPVFACEMQLGLSTFEIYDLSKETDHTDAVHFIPLCFYSLYKLLKCDKAVNLLVDVQSSPTTIEHFIPWASTNPDLLPSTLQKCHFYVADNLAIDKLDEKYGTIESQAFPINRIDRNKPPVIPKPVLFSAEAYTHAVHIDIGDLMKSITMVALMDVEKLYVQMHGTELRLETTSRCYQGSDTVRGDAVRLVTMEEVLSTCESERLEQVKPGVTKQVWKNDTPLRICVSLRNLYIAVFFAWKFHQGSSIYLCMSKQAGLLMHFPLIGFGTLVKMKNGFDRDVFLRNRVTLFRPDAY
jgi:hypothetical protein